MIVRPAYLGLLALAVLGCGISVGPITAGESPVGKLIADVVPVNNRLHPKEHILSQMQMRPGKTYDEAQMNEDVRKLIATKWFAPDGVQVETTVSGDGKVTIYLKLIELNSVVDSVEFIGAQHIGKDTLLQLTGIRKGSALNPAFNEAAAQIIENKLKEDGRAYATCRLMEGTKITDKRVVFNIVEGPVVKVSRASIRGCQQTSSGRVSTQLTIKAPLYGIIRFINDKYNVLQVEDDKKKIINYFHKLGYLEARVQEEVIPSRDLSSVEIIFHVDEGAVYKVREIRLEGNKIFTAEPLRRLIELKQGERYDRDVIAADAARIKNYYGYRGYYVVCEEQWIAVAGKPGFVDVIYQLLEPGARDGGAGASKTPPVRRVSHQVPLDDGFPLQREPDRIGRIEIRGNEVTMDRVIRNELGMAGIREGQVLQYPSLEVAKLNLYRRGIFDMEAPPTVEVRQSDVDSTFKDVIVTVKETRTGQFMIGGAVNSNSGLTGNIAINERNFDILRVPTSLDDFLNGRAFRGAGQELRLEAQPGTLYQRYTATFREPYLFNTNYGLTTSGYYYNRGYAEYDENRVGARVSLDRRLDLYWRTNLTTRIEDVNIKNLPIDAPDAITRDRGHSTIVGIRPGITRDSRDSYVFPTTGSVFDLAYEQLLGDYTVPIGTAEFTKFFSSEYLQRKDGSGKHVFALRSQVSATSSDAPVFERFFAGGFRSIRGFSFRGVGPASYSAYGNKYFTGGTFSFLNTMEYQIPLNAKDSLFFVTFLDHGTVEQSIAIKDYRVSAGFGFRVSIPALGPVPVAFDFAFPLNRTDTDNKQVFAFYIGLFGGQ
ncbi:BamA/OMP85 family outer membrane protein [Limnoglobus roseus]|uniref:Outer membrane protein assembly factor BamA n=1 Tax=Limnoglobus roseus TaxID=2598579 RepID=A0A5C1ANI7_9BACT|nr:BamA/TamA family outer membrane protein [Limnoglobus roseus]QEL18418.1 outer membrane protein assembly factor BamA [Limnoglobus roseus]